MKFFIEQLVLISNLFELSRLNETGLALLTTRLVEQWQRKCFECFKSWLPISQLLLTEWHASRDRLLEITLNGLEHQIDVVRHTSKEAFLLNLKIHVLLKSIENVKNIAT